MGRGKEMFKERKEERREQKGMKSSILERKEGQEQQEEFKRVDVNSPETHPVNST